MVSITDASTAVAGVPDAEENVAASTPESTLPAQIGRLVRQHRTAQKLSMRALAHTAGVSQPFLSRLENGHLLPSMSNLYALAAALGIAPPELMPEVSGSATGSSPVHFPVLHAEATGRMQLLSGGPGRRLEAYRFIAQPGYRDDAEYQHGGEEFVYVIQGTVRLRQRGRPDRILHAGDSITIDPSIGHCWSVPDDAERDTEYLLACTSS